MTAHNSNDSLEQLLSYNTRLVDDDFTHRVQAQLARHRGRRRRILTAGGICSAAVAGVLLVVNGHKIGGSIMQAVNQSPYLVTLGIVALCAVTLWSWQKRV